MNTTSGKTVRGEGGAVTVAPDDNGVAVTVHDAGKACHAVISKDAARELAAVLLELAEGAAKFAPGSVYDASAGTTPGSVYDANAGAPLATSHEQKGAQ